MDLLFRQHPGENLPALNDPVEQRPVVIPDQLKGPAVASEDVVLLLDRTDVVGLREKLGECLSVEFWGQSRNCYEYDQQDELENLTH